MVLLPMNSTIHEEISQLAEYGMRSKNGMLYHVGAPLSQFIAPVCYMWCPSLYENFVHDEQGHVKSISAKQESIASKRQLWLWIHAASFEEGLDALKTACEKQMHESGVSVSCVSLDERITKLEVTGSKAIQILRKTLHPAPETKYETNHHLSKCSYLTDCTSSKVQKPFLSNAENLPFDSVISMTVSDPRDFHPHKSYADLESSRKQIDMLENDTLAPWSNSEKKAVHLSQNFHLWDSNAKLKPPLPEKLVCTDRHQQRLKDFFLDSDTGEGLAPEARDAFGRCCPILLSKHATRDDFVTKWSIVLPLSWTKVFWLSLLSHGAHAIGLRERRWIACDSELPCFPYDFPDSKSYSLLMSDEATSFKSHAELCPPAVRPLNIPIPPPWHCIESTCNGLLEMNESSEFSVKQPCDVSSCHQSEVLFNGFMVRQSKVLRDYLISNPDRMATKKGLCLVRVLVRAFKEGAFEDGAVICAPVLADLPLWKFRSEEMDKLQIPQSVLKSYFMQHESGRWDVQLPHNCPNQESYRWPIGFITTGFIRGSKKPRAIGFCEAKLLAQLRKQQLTVGSESRSEIRVLVRNMRSTVYRRAYANIVIEGGKDDAEFL